jgi:hypothetical protein
VEWALLLGFIHAFRDGLWLCISGMNVTGVRLMSSQEAHNVHAPQC